MRDGTIDARPLTSPSRRTMVDCHRWEHAKYHPQRISANYRVRFRIRRAWADGSVRPVMPPIRSGLPGDEPPVTYVTITDVDMSITAMTAFMIKWAIATIPALIILFGLAAVLTLVLGGLLGIGF